MSSLLLPLEIWEEIFLYLSSKDIASFAAVFPFCKSVLQSRYFLKKFALCKANLNKQLIVKCFLQERLATDFVFIKPGNYWCFNSGLDCIACKLTPYLLLMSPFEVICKCEDHMFLWYNTNLYV
ncbi:RH2 [Bovine adenovirus 7]|uniref:RH2 protein n=1 Tax=Bovine adenovirus 7 TaxID=10511 RepID=A0A7R7FRL3_ADEB7|nr:RH2 [Bovine adenovirus 7]BCS90537.1 RH2 [Bovine adenovirus 7]